METAGRHTGLKGNWGSLRLLRRIWTNMNQPSHTQSCDLLKWLFILWKHLHFQGYWKHVLYIILYIRNRLPFHKKVINHVFYTDVLRVWSVAHLDSRFSLFFPLSLSLSLSLGFTLFTKHNKQSDLSQWHWCRNVSTALIKKQYVLSQAVRRQRALWKSPKRVAVEPGETWLSNHIYAQYLLQLPECKCAAYLFQTRCYKNEPRPGHGRVHPSTNFLKPFVLELLLAVKWIFYI